MILHGYWRSIATMRVRIGLAMKGLAAEEVPVDLLAGDQHAPAFRAVNPAGAVPALVAAPGAPALVQSLAILEWLEETRPDPPLLPRGAAARARVRALALIAAADTHPLSVPRVRRALAERFGADDAATADWARHWLGQGAAALEGHLARDAATGAFCHGDVPGIADICLFSLTTSARLYGLDLSPFPVVAGIAARCAAIEAFAAAHPLRQAGAPHRGS